MLERTGSLWDHHNDGGHIVITTNIGWKKHKINPMGAGVAKIAANMYPELPGWYGNRCWKYGEKTAVCYYETGRIFLFPTKPMYMKPWLSWMNDSDIDLIRRSSVQLAKLVDVLTERGHCLGDIVLPLPGCGCGNLRSEDVLPIIKQYLDDRFVLFIND